MQSFHYGAAYLVPAFVFAGDHKLLFAATKRTPCDHRSACQYGFITATTDSGCLENRAFEGISMDCLGLASVQATTSGIIRCQRG
ncbi:YcjX family protein [Shigella flexneri]